MAAYRNYIKGRICPQAARILKNYGHPEQDKCLVWTPGHQGVEGNECAHAAARALLPRDSTPPSSTPPYPGPLATYAERLQHCRLSRRKYPPPAKGLSKAEEVRWRRLQTGTYNTPARLNTIHPGFCDPKCKYCGEKAGLHHMVWTCPHNPPDDPNAVPTIEGWEAALSSSGLEAQRALVTRARVAAAAAGVPD